MSGKLSGDGNLRDSLSCGLRGEKMWKIRVWVFFFGGGCYNVLLVMIHLVIIVKNM